MINFILAFLLFGQLPGASARVLLDSTVVTVSRKGTSETERHIKLEILNQRGRDRYGDVKERYNKEKQKFEILKAVTVKANGETVKPEKKAIMDVGDPMTYNAPMYANFIMKVISFPALDSGSVIDYHYRIKPRGKKGEGVFFGSVKFGTFEPIVKKIYTVTIPSSMEFFYSKAPTQRSMHGERITLTWENDDVNKIEEEPAIPPLELLVPTLHVSSFRSWDKVATWIWGKLKEGIAPEGVKEFSRGKSFEELVSFVKKDVRGIKIPLSMSGFKSNKAKEVLKNRYGDSKDKAILLVSLLRASGIQAWPALVSSNLKDFPQIADPSILDRALVKVIKEGKIYWIDPLMDYSLPPTYRPSGVVSPSPEVMGSSLFYSGFGGHTVLTFYGDSSKIEKVRSPLSNFQNTVAELVLDEEGNLRGVFKAEYYGNYDSRIRKILSERTKEERKRWIKSRISSVGVGAELTSYKIENLDDLTKPISISAEFTDKSFVSLKEKESPITLPRNIFSLDDLAYVTSLRERKNPLLARPLRRSTYDISLTLPSDFEVKEFPMFSRASPGFTCEVKSEIKKKTFSYSSSFAILSWEIMPEDYVEFRNAVRSFMLEKRRRVLLLKTNL